VLTRTAGGVLVGRRVRLRPLVDSDFNEWREVRERCRDWLLPWEPGPPGVPPDLVGDWRSFATRCSSRAREAKAGNAYGFGIFVGDRFAGEMNLSSVQRGPFQNGYVGYWVDRALAGHGYVPEAAVVMMRFAFEDLSLHRLQVSVVPRNSASRRVAEKLGLRHEGVAVRYLQINGNWEDHIRYAVTSEEWDAGRHDWLATWLA